MAHKRQIKSVAHFVQTRPKKTGNAKIFPSPPIYYPDTNDYFGSPPEYYSAPVPEAVELINSQTWLPSIFNTQDHEDREDIISKCKQLSDGLDTISKNSVCYALTQECDVSEDLSLFFKRLSTDFDKYKHYLSPLSTLEIIQKQWEIKENHLFNRCRRRLFGRLKTIYHKLKSLGFTETQLKDPEIWHRYGVFKSLPKCTMTDVYFEKHKFGIEFGAKNLYYIDNGEIKSNIGLLDSTDKTLPEGTYFNSPEEALSNEVLEVILNRLKDMEFWKLNELGDQYLINIAKCYHTQLDYKNKEAIEVYAIRDYFLSWLYPNYVLPKTIYDLEVNVCHKYRIKSLEKILLEMLNCWIGTGAPKPLIRGKTEKYRNVIIWKTLTKKVRKRIAHQYMVKLLKKKKEEKRAKRIEKRRLAVILRARKNKKRLR